MTKPAADTADWLVENHFHKGRKPVPELYHFPLQGGIHPVECSPSGRKRRLKPVRLSYSVLGGRNGFVQAPFISAGFTGSLNAYSPGATQGLLRVCDKELVPLRPWFKSQGQEYLLLPVIILLLELPVHQSTLRLGTALQECAAVLYAIVNLLFQPLSAWSVCRE